MCASSPRSQVLSSMESPSHRACGPAIDHEVERRTEVADLGLGDELGVHRADQISARQVEQLVAIGGHEPALEALQRQLRQAAVALDAMPDRRDEHLLGG